VVTPLILRPAGAPVTSSLITCKRHTTLKILRGLGEFCLEIGPKTKHLFHTLQL
jgi:hypothetical protein